MVLTASQAAIGGRHYYIEKRISTRSPKKDFYDGIFKIMLKACFLVKTLKLSHI